MQENENEDLGKNYKPAGAIKKKKRGQYLFSDYILSFLHTSAVSCRVIMLFYIFMGFFFSCKTGLDTGVIWVLRATGEQPHFIKTVGFKNSEIICKILRGFRNAYVSGKGSEKAL